MIAIRDYNSLLKDLATNCSMPIEKVILARTEAELSIYLKDIANYCLIGIIPSSDTVSPDQDNIQENEPIIIYVLHPVAEKDKDATTLITDISNDQQYIKDVKNRLHKLYDDFESPLNPLIQQLNFGTMHTDPEYNYMGCDGYSLSFVLTTDGF